MVGKEQVFKKILVAVDGSKGALNAAQLAARLAKNEGAELLVLHVVDKAVLEEMEKFMGQPPQALEKEIEEQAWALLHSTEILLKEYRVPVRLFLKEGTPYQEIINTAEKEGVDLIVLGKLGKRGERKILMGSSVFRVMEFSTIPVLVVD